MILFYVIIIKLVSKIFVPKVPSDADSHLVVSASSDGTVKAWNPHSQQDPSIIGTHSDYVRCLGYW